MGYYDNRRDGYCEKCGIAFDNINNGICEICHPSPQKTTNYIAEEAVLTSLAITAEETFVFENGEVKKTGRKATNKLRSGKIDEVVEITPVDSISGSWKKWVRDDTLFRVQK